MRLYGTLQEIQSLTIRTTAGDTVQLVAAEQSHASGAVSVTIPDLGASSNSDEIVMVTLSQTLLNKTLTSPVITSANINSSSVLQLPLSAPGTNALGRLYLVGSDLRFGTSATPGAYEQVVTQTSSSNLTNKTLNLASGNGNSISNANPTSLLATELTNADKVIRYDASGIPVVDKIVNANVANNAGISGTKLADNSINVSKLVTAETTGSGNVVLQTNPTLSTVTASSGILTVSGTGALRLPLGTDAQQPTGTAANLKGMIRYNDEKDAFEGYNELSGWSALGGGGTIDRVTQASHGFVIGDVLWLNGSVYAKALANAANTAEVVGVVSRFIDANTFELTLSGEVTGLTGLVAGEVYFLSPSTSGALTVTEPSVVGQVSLPVGVASSTTSLYVAPKRGVVVGGANLRTQIGLNGDAILARTTNIQNVSAYEAGELAGWVYIDATADRRFYIQVQFVKDAANAWKCAYQTTGDTPPQGFNVDVIVSGADAFVQVQMPPVAGFNSVTSNINFALNAPAVGATLPLQIDSANVSFTNIQAASSAGIAFKEDGGTTTMTITDAGNVGIGTTNPTQKLDVYAGSLSVGSHYDGTLNTDYKIRLRSVGAATNNNYLGEIGLAGGGVQPSDSSLTFSTQTWNGSAYVTSEKMRIDASGNLLVGSTGSVLGEKLRVNGKITLDGVGIHFIGANIFGTANAMGLRWSGPDIIGTVDNVAYAVLGTTSDYRLKTDFQQLDSCLDKISKLKPLTYFCKDFDGTIKDERRTGFIAHEIQEVFPDLATLHKDAQDEQGNPQYQSVNYAGLTPYLVKAIQEQQAQIEELKAKLAALEAK